MEINELKIHLLQKLMTLEDQDLLKKIDHLVNEEMIVAYTTDGRPLTKAQYDDRLTKAEKQIEKGEYLTQEEVEKRMANRKSA